jgi:protein-disulfide isomerase
MNAQTQRQRVLITIGVMVAVAIVAAGAMIVLSSRNTTSSPPVDYSQIPQSRTEDGAFVLGNPEAPITVVEFADFLCPHCQEYKPTINQFIQEYVVTGKAKLEYRMFPTVDVTGYASQLAECVEELKPGSFWEGHDTLYQLTSASRFDPNTTPRLFAERMELDYGKLLECAQDARQIQTDAQFGQSLGVSGTPAVLVRYGDSAPTWVGGQTRGALSYEALQLVVETAG